VSLPVGRSQRDGSGPASSEKVTTVRLLLPRSEAWGRPPRHAGKTLFFADVETAVQYTRVPDKNRIPTEWNSRPDFFLFLRGVGRERVRFHGGGPGILSVPTGRVSGHEAVLSQFSDQRSHDSPKLISER